ncbi:lanthionine synthetase C family protein [Streptomyces sp. AK02-01A]|uniref:lanthionine synthetase C family protein n=1 Tax=Streptomyces sp. AK02-01A TaxID=3028648 RepID=UPI0029AB0119|nr:lanthionine synthetase C family protein [Streptomyces sp. AK02-01A]MDX3850226.1 lanthionine synthetase C family protein [Streptomyces sp. AK02-01A]
MIISATALPAVPAMNPDTTSRQSLSQGPLGTALLHIERAHRNTGTWQTVHRWLSAAADRPLIDGNTAGLFLGAPAMAYAMNLAAADSDRYAGALHTLDSVVAIHTQRRLDAAHTRIDRGELTSFVEYDLLRGLTGLGALLLRRTPYSDVLKGVLSYLVRLTEPLPSGPSGRTLPGWWVWHGPTDLAAPTPGGHANAGVAHGISGPLALLALASRRGITVDGQDDAMRRICRWLDGVRQTNHHGTWWARWVTENAAVPRGPAAPSWCYGTPGLARAQQLAGIALGDLTRQRMAERALLYCLADSVQLNHLAGRGLCHGVGGLMRVVQRVATDSETPTALTVHLPQLSERFLAVDPPKDISFLDGSAGAALAFYTAEADELPACDWDTCLLLV